MEGWGWQSVHDPATLPKVTAQWQRSIETGQPFELTFPLKGADGVFRTFLTRAAPLRGADRRVYRGLGINTDVTEIFRASEIREPFTAVLGHDLRNPLTAITSGLTLPRRTPLKDRAVLLADMTRESAARMAALIDDITDFARCRLGDGLALNRAPRIFGTNASRGHRGIGNRHARTRGVETHFALQWPVICDWMRVARLFSNLLGNA